MEVLKVRVRRVDLGMERRREREMGRGLDIEVREGGVDVWEVDM